MSGPERQEDRELTADELAARAANSGRHRDPGDAWVVADDGRKYWGRFGAAGLLAHDPARGILLQHRVSWSDHGGTWGIPGGARHQGEDAVIGAIRESNEEAGVPPKAILPRFAFTVDRGGWTYTTVVAEVITPFEPEITDPESEALEWVPVDAVERYELHPGFGSTWPLLLPLLSSEANGRLSDTSAIDELASLGELTRL